MGCGLSSNIDLYTSAPEDVLAALLPSSAPVHCNIISDLSGVYIFVILHLNDKGLFFVLYKTVLHSKEELSSKREIKPCGGMPKSFSEKKEIKGWLNNSSRVSSSVRNKISLTDNAMPSKSVITVNTRARDLSISGAVTSAKLLRICYLLKNPPENHQKKNKQ